MPHHFGARATLACPPRSLFLMERTFSGSMFKLSKFQTVQVWGFLPCTLEVIEIVLHELTLGINLNPWGSWDWKKPILINISISIPWKIDILVYWFFILFFFQYGNWFSGLIFSTFFNLILIFLDWFFSIFFSGIWHLGHCCLSRFFKYIPCKKHQRMPLFFSQNLCSLGWNMTSVQNFWVKHSCCLRWWAFFNPL